jgi:hypothetical protein
MGYRGEVGEPSGNPHLLRAGLQVVARGSSGEVRRARRGAPPKNPPAGFLGRLRPSSELRAWGDRPGVNLRQCLSAAFNPSNLERTSHQTGGLP